MNRKPNKKVNKARYFWMTLVVAPFLYVIWLLSQDYNTHDGSVFDA